MRKTTRAAFLSLAMLPGLAAADGAADLLQTFKPFAEAKLSYDSNLFRLPDTAAASTLLGKAQLDDRFLTAGVGIDGSIDVSKQNFVIQGEIFRNVYSEFGSQDFTEANADLIWNWAAGERWDGELAYRFDRDRQDYANQSVGQSITNPPLKNIRTRNAVEGQANFLLTREWTLYGRTSVKDISFDRNSDLLDLERRSVGAGADYTTRVGNRIGIDADFIDGEYDTNSRLDYEEYNIGPTANWSVSGKTRVRGKIDYTDRSYSDSSQEDFDGITWRATLVRNPEEETTAEAAVYREISTLNDDISNYAVIDGISVIPQFKISGRTLLKFLASYEIRDFKGSSDPANPLPPGTPQREDKVATAAAEVEWEATRAITLFGGITYEERSSNRRQEKYDYALIEIGVRGGF